jgi:hypothetical protein
MQIKYGFVFYLVTAVICFTVALVFLYFKPIRHLWFKLIQRFGIGKGIVFQMAFWIAFVIISVILIDSIMIYLQLKN